MKIFGGSEFHKLYFPMISNKTARKSFFFSLEIKFVWKSWQISSIKILSFFYKCVLRKYLNKKKAANKQNKTKNIYLFCKLTRLFTDLGNYDVYVNFMMNQEKTRKKTDNVGN